MTLRYTVAAMAVAIGVSAVPAPHPQITPPPMVPRGLIKELVGGNVFTFGPGYTVTSTVINGSTYPIFNAGVQGGYHATATQASFTGLLGVGEDMSYTTLGGSVYPVYQFTLNEADSEIFTIPGLLTFRDGGLSTNTAQATDVHCALGTNGQAGCVGLAGLVTGAILGVPFTNEGGMNPTLAVPLATGGTLLAANTASGVFIAATSSEGGQIGGGISKGPGSSVSIGGGAGNHGNDITSNSGQVTASFVTNPSTTKAGACITEAGVGGACVPPKATSTSK